ncbi:aminotransferase class V-fold PLP-dependent enzyme [candidate division KSB1 bacterium]
MDLNNIRKEFPILEKTIYMNSCSLGALSRRSRQYVIDYLDLWDKMGASAWYEKWMSAIDDVRTMFATVLGADASEIALGQNISGLLSSLGSCFDFKDRNGIVITDMDFPTSNYQWLAKRELGADIRIIESEDRIYIPEQEFERAIDNNTAIISTSHVFFLSGYIQDISKINACARENNALCIIDAYQSVGQVPVNVREMNIDVLLGGGLKWLLGGSGITFMYIKKELIKSLSPTITGWFGVKDQFSFGQTDFTYHDDARRFETGTPPVAAIVAARGGLELVLEIGLENIWKMTKDITEELIHELKKAGIKLRIPENSSDRSAIVMAVHPDPAPVVKALAEKNIIVDYRKDCIRISPYFYNNSEDVERFVKTLSELV